MLVADTSALVSLAIASVLEDVLAEFDVHTTDLVVDELEDTASYDDVHGDGATGALRLLDDLTVHDGLDPAIRSSRIDVGEASCLALDRELDPDFLFTDDLRALPELQVVATARVAISPIVLRALVKRDVLDTDDALEKLEILARSRGWLGAPIYRRARRLFDEP